ncbi:TetR/AcrR family transcriptional regulator [Paraconexibacter sp. AEG42_29]|uniref:TetR/AcrR family transcriptional regulator n=1 Tax=Paraconexibacter sp. AEG42_29 TaxID=2997339 RepID=UPI00339D74C7
MALIDAWPATQPRRFSERQHAVLDALEQVFDERGLRAVTLSDLTAAARCSRTTLYDIAPGKEQLFLVVLDRVMRRIAAGGRDAAARVDDPIEQVAAITTAAAAGLGRMSPVFLDSVNAHPAATLLYERHVSDARDTVERVMQHAIDQRLCRPIHPRVVADSLIVLALHFGGPRAMPAHDLGPTEALRQALDLLVAGLRA